MHPHRYRDAAAIARQRQMDAGGPSPAVSSGAPARPVCSQDHCMPSDFVDPMLSHCMPNIPMMPVPGIPPVPVPGMMMPFPHCMPFMPPAPPVPPPPVQKPVAPPCHLHQKHKDKCKFCTKHKDSKEDGAVSAHTSAPNPFVMYPSMVPDDPAMKFTNDTMYNVNALLRDQILKSGFFKSLLDELHLTVESVIGEVYNHVDNVEPYMSHSTTEPSTFFCCLYRLFTIRLTSQQLRDVLNCQDNVYVRALGFLYMRYVFHCNMLWDWCQEYLFDGEQFRSSPRADLIEMGVFVEKLIAEDKYFDTMLPRLPQAGFRQKKSRFLALLNSQYRPRQRANMKVLEEYSIGRKIEACSKGDWLDGEVAEVVDYGHRVVVKCTLEDGVQEDIPLGMVILRDPPLEEHSSADEKDKARREGEREPEGREREGRERDGREREESDVEGGADAAPVEESNGKDRDRSRERERNRSRSRRGDRSRGDKRDRRDGNSRRNNNSAVTRSRSRDRRARPSASDGQPVVDLTRSRGDMTEDQLQEYIATKSRNSALATGKDYAAKPQGYKAMLAMSRTNYGSEERRMTEEETFIRIERRKQRQGLPRERECVDERAREEQNAHKQKIMEKYSNAAPTAASAKRRPAGGDGADMLRFG